jgi:hypothetical protein
MSTLGSSGKSQLSAFPCPPLPGWLAALQLLEEGGAEVRRKRLEKEARPSNLMVTGLRHTDMSSNLCS